MEEAVFVKSNVEKTSVFMIIASVIIGVLFDILVYFGYPLIIVDDFESYVQVVIQVQATCATLGITIITLLGNVMSKRILGMSVADFVMNRQRRILTQKYSIVLCLIFALASVFMYVIQLYNLIFGLFAASIFIVSYMVVSISQIFQPEEVLTNQIKQYILEHLDDKGVLDSFFGEVDKEKESLRGYKLEEYKDFFLKIWEEVLDGVTEEKISNGNIEIFKVVTTGQTKVVTCFINAKNGEQYQTAIELLNSIYQKYNEVDIDRSIETELNIFYDVYEDLVVQLKKDYQIDSYKLINSIPDEVFAAGTYSLTDKEGNRHIQYTKDIRSLAEYYRFLVNMLCKNELNAKDRYNLSVVCVHGIKGFRAVLREKSDGSNEVMEQRKRLAKDILIRYVISLLLKGDIELVQNAFFDNFMGHYYGSSVNEEDDIVLTILAYMHYLAYSESKELLFESGIGKDEMCRTLWKDNADKIEEFLRRLYINYKVTAESLDEIIAVLRSYEAWGKRNSKMLIMEDSVRNFIIITAALYTNRAELEKLYANIIRNNEYFAYYEQFCADEQKAIVLKEMECFWTGTLDNSQIDKQDGYESRVELSYSALVDSISTLYAKKASIEAREINQKINIRKENNILEVLVKEHFDKLFNNISCIRVLNDIKVGDLDNCAKKKMIRKSVVLMDAIVPSQFAQADSIMNHIESILDANVISILKACIGLHRSIESKSYEYNENVLSNYLNDIMDMDDYDVVIGTKNSWINIPMEDYQSFNEWVDRINSLLILGLGREKYLINLNSKKVDIFIKCLNVEVRDFTTEEALDEIREQDGLYMVNVTNDIWLKYDKDDAIEYIKRSKKKVSISATIEILTSGKNVGRINWFVRMK